MRKIFALPFILCFVSQTLRASVPERVDGNAHFMVGFQLAILSEQVWQASGYGKLGSVIFGNCVVLATALGKEYLIDETDSEQDISNSMLGSLASSTIFALLPKGSFELEAEGGIFNYDLRGNRYSLPATSIMVKAQTTIWWQRIVGFHQFSGGFDTGEKDNSGKRLIYGMGIRLPLIPVIQSGRNTIISTWMGVDYGLILFSADDTSESLKKFDETFFYSLGVRLQLSKNIHLGIEAQYIPYEDSEVWEGGGSIGFLL